VIYLTRKKTTRKVSKKRVSRKKVQKKSKAKYFGLAIIFIATFLAYIFLKPSEEIVNDEVVAFVNGEPIYLAELESELSKLPPQLLQTLDQKTILSQLIDKKLLLVKALETSVDVDESINLILESNNITVEELITNLESQGISMEDFKNQLRIFNYLNQTVFSDISISDEELVEYYELNPSSFIVPETVFAKHILVSNNNRTNEEALALINEIKAMFEKNNSIFCELVTQYSEDPGSVANCGEYPAFGRDSNFVEEYKEAAFSNKIGEASIAKTQFGYHLIWSIEKTPERIVELNEVKEQIRTALLFEKQKEVFNVYIKELRAETDIINCFETPNVELCGSEKEETEKITETKEITSENEDFSEEQPNSLESFADCLTLNDVKMYGAYWCSHCANQKELFEDAFKKITYVECAIEGSREQTTVCKEAEIKGYPSWDIKGKIYPGEQTLEQLSELSGCPL
tara:strand:- start:768 stop:2144 length:1377 start_codon:yes stop_codon:yes gene_type:complete